MRPTKQDIFSASTEWLDLTSASGEHHSAEVIIICDVTTLI